MAPGVWPIWPWPQRRVELIAEKYARPPSRARGRESMQPVVIWAAGAVNKPANARVPARTRHELPTIGHALQVAPSGHRGPGCGTADIPTLPPAAGARNERNSGSVQK